jgi:uncharacterized protein YcbK (DUF882 family)
MFLSRKEFLWGAMGAAICVMSGSSVWAKLRRGGKVAHAKRFLLSRSKQKLLQSKKLIQSKKGVVKAKQSLATKKVSVIQGRKKKLILPDMNLSLYNIHTGQSIKGTFFADGRYQMSEIRRIFHLFRDHRTNQMGPVCLPLLMLLHSMKKLLGYERPFEIVSAFRCERTNQMLRRMGRRVARNSLHLKGKAIDVRFTGLTLERAYRAGCHLRRGGVGLYPRSRFVHLDVRGGLVTWKGV